MQAGSGRQFPSARGAAVLGAAWLLAVMAPGRAKAAEAVYVDAKDASYGFVECGTLCRFFKAYADEWGKSAPPANPDAPSAVSRRPSPFPPAPLTQPPYPFTDWPYGGSQTIGASVPNAVNSPVMTALAPTDSGKWLNANHIQIYGWVEAGANASTAQGAKLGNFPAADMYKPNTGQLDQAVLVFERVPDTVQQDHIDWGFRFLTLYGENYRYTIAYGLVSYQLLKHNFEYGYDFPNAYGELYIPKVADGLVIRFGRYTAVPDIESQLAPTNYMYSHSFTVWTDNVTNTGILASLQANKNWILQLGISSGTDTVPWNSKDPGTQPSLTACARWNSDDSWHNVYVCANGINNGEWGYDNQQWYGFSTFHKLNEKWHLSFEFWDTHQNHVAAIGTPDIWNTPGLPTFIPNPFARPNQAFCPPGELFCTASQWSALLYLNYRYSEFDNFTFRAEYFSDTNGQRTGVKTDYDNFAIGWQHWFSPSVIVRPEIALYNTVNGVNAFGRDSAGVPHQSSIAVFSVDTIIHF
jgi:hypothetical protein